MYFHIGPQPFANVGHGYMGFNPSWMDIAAPIGVGGLWLWWFFSELKKRPLLPPKDPFVENAIKHGQGH